MQLFQGSRTIWMSFAFWSFWANMTLIRFEPLKLTELKFFLLHTVVTY
jgi:hypothetical protein